MKETKTRTIRELVLAFFQAHPKQDLPHGPVVDWVTNEWLKEHSEPPRDPWRMIRRLHQEGILVKVCKGIYRYDPDLIQSRRLMDFSPAQREEILKRDDYRCVICGRGPNEGYELHVDHIIPKELGGEAEIWNGQTLCSVHNFRKKHYKQTETGKRMFIQLYELAKKLGDENTINFCRDILEVFEKHGMNGHIQWDK